MIKFIIDELSDEGIHLQEIRLNLCYQGYSGLWDIWVKLQFFRVLYPIIDRIIRDDLKEKGLL